MKISKDCMDEALTALKDFSKEELKQYAFDVFEKAEKFTNMSNMRAFDEAMKEINDERLKSYFESAMTAANNARKIESDANDIRKGKANVQTILVKRHTNLGGSARAAQMAAQEELEGTFFNKVSREETSFFSTGDNDLLIADAFDSKKVESKEAIKISSLLKDVYFPERNAELVTSNAMPFDHINEDRSFRNIHDSNKMILGGKSAINEAKSKRKFTIGEAKQKWIETIKKRFDLVHSDAILPDGTIDETRLNQIIGEMYDNITTGKSDINTRSMVVNDRVAIQNRSRRRLQPKSMRDFVEYNKEYGQGNLFKAMLMDMQTSSNKIGVARKLGDSPHAAYFDLRKVQQEVDPKDQKWWAISDRYFKDVMGMDKTAIDPKRAAFDANIRSVSSMARLGLMIVPRSIPDVNFMASFAQLHGYNYFSAFGHHFKYLLDLYPSSQRKYLAKRYASLFRQHLGYMGRFGEANNISERLNKISTGFFKVNGLHAYDQGNKMSGMEIASMGIGRYSKKTYEKLPLPTRNWIDKFMSPEAWELLRHKTKNKLFTVDNVDALSEKEIKNFYESGDRILPLHEVRNDLYRRVHSISQIATENMVLNPSEFERAFLLRGTRPGAPEGVLLRQITQFKGFMLTYIDKVYIQGSKNADANQQKLAWATTHLIMGGALTYGMKMFENFAMGKSMPDITKMNALEASKFLLDLLAPGLSMFSGILDTRHLNSDSIISLFGSPSLRLMGEALTTFIYAADVTNKNYKKDVSKHFINTMSLITPIKTIPFLSPFIKEMVGEKGYLEPGQTHYYGR
jgi:hypothetical protein